MSDPPSWYDLPDPWGYRSNPDDANRRLRIIEACQWMLGQRPAYERALDIGAGEGWITGALPAKQIHGIEISDSAAARFPANVRRVVEPDGRYDLILATGVLYAQYDYEAMWTWIENAALWVVVTAGIEEWELYWIRQKFERNFQERLAMRFPYREWNQVVRVYENPASYRTA